MSVDNIGYAEVDWLQLTEGTVKCQALVNWVMNFKVPYILTS